MDLAAPGDEIFSTVQPGVEDYVALVATGGTTRAYGSFMDGGGMEGASGTLVDCGIGDEVCPGSGGHICLIQRGTVYFSEKAENCAASGAIGGIIYNNKPGKWWKARTGRYLRKLTREQVSSWAHSG